MKKLILSSFIFCWTATQVFAQNESKLPIGSEYVVENIKELNSDQLDFCAIPFQEGVIFTSNREDERWLECHNPDDDTRFTNLLYAEENQNGEFVNIQLLSKNVNEIYHDGVATFDQAGKIVFFSRNNKVKNELKEIDLDVVMADVEGTAWSNVQDLPWNTPLTDECHPSLSVDGLQLFFASNRPGGYGGMDIWMSVHNGSIWGEPMNLGPNVNTKKNEIFPFVRADGVLFFSSNGHKGKGGLDMFMSSKLDEYDDLSWDAPLNLGKPINSKGDDFGFYANISGTKGYLSSNRNGGIGQDDIYRWSVNELEFKIPVCFTDEETGEVLADVEAILVPVSSSFEANIENSNNDGDVFVVSERVKTSGKVLVSDVEGSAIYNGKINEAFYISIIKDGYELKDIVIPTQGFLDGETSCIALKKEAPEFIPFSGFVQSSTTKKGIPTASITIIDKCNDKTTEVIADINGFFEYTMTCGCEYEFIGAKNNYNNGKTITKADCDNNARILTYVELDPAPAIKIGHVIVLEDLYYDFDKFYIRSDASIELDKVVDFMNTYPSLEIEVGSHTDSRGTASYNAKLSENRAKAAVEYIISRGVSRSRVTAEGYGERQLTNQCANGVECSDEEHQLNRRTEIKVTKLSNPNVRILDQHGFSN